jgi:hypothetical protein
MTEFPTTRFGKADKLMKVSESSVHRAKARKAGKPPKPTKSKPEPKPGMSISANDAGDRLRA